MSSLYHTPLEQKTTIGDLILSAAISAFVIGMLIACASTLLKRPEPKTDVPKIEIIDTRVV